MRIERSAAETFFADYAKALASRDAKRVATFWGVPSLVLSDQGAIAVSQPDEIEAFFASAMGQYANVATTHAAIVAMRIWSDLVAECAIDWEHRNAAGKPSGREQGHYVLRNDNGRLRIQVYTPKEMHISGPS